MTLVQSREIESSRMYPSLDDLADPNPAVRDPSALLMKTERITIDEIQQARNPLSAIKREVDGRRTRFLPCDLSRITRALDRASRQGTNRSDGDAMKSPCQSLPVANSRQAVNHTVDGVRVRSKIVPAVTDVRPPHPEHMNLHVIVEDHLRLYS